MVTLTQNEKIAYCKKLASVLPTIRSILDLTQAELGSYCGFSRNRVTAIENGKFIMTWSQFTSILYFVSVNGESKKYIIDNRIFDKKLYQYLQRKDEDAAPDLYIPISYAAATDFAINIDEALIK